MTNFFTTQLDLRFLPQREFESISGLTTAQEKTPVLVRNLLRLLMMGWTKSWRSLISSDVLHAIFITRNHEYLREMRFAFQQGFHEIFNQLKELDYTEEDSEQIQLYLSNCLSLLPYGDLTPYESISIPQYIDNHWEMVEYQIKPIELTEGHERDCDRVFAYGLEPLFQRKAESHLIFMGTTYTAGQGFLPQVKTDAKGFESVGKTLYRTGRPRIQKWLEQQENTVHVCGTSLGGSLSLLLAIDKGNYRLSRVDALNPAGLHDAWSKSRFDHWDELTEKPKVVVQKQGNDPVSYFGVWKKGWNILEVSPPADKKGSNGIWDHILNYAGIEGTKYNHVDPEVDNSQRKKRNLWLFSFGRSVFYYGLMVPYYYLIRPISYFLVKNWPLAIILPTLAVTTHFALAGLLTGIALAAVTTVLVSAAVAVIAWNSRGEKQFLYAKLHDPKLPRVKDNDLYSAENEVEIELKYQEINSYYNAIRCLVKGKEFIPASEQSSKYVATTKKALLEESKKEENAETVVSFKLTKAKAAHIFHTLSFIRKFANDDKSQLKQILQDSYEEYRLGKHSK
ncbi:MAG: hypothetical protein QM652_10285 [Legionella sp.]|uniref:hypothetical protein n=1 Tax=Legionella sp. TaxID=459 RepID=UPI0039E33A61